MEHKLLILLIVVAGISANFVLAFPPPSPDQDRIADEQVNLCESTGGIANKTSVGGCQELDPDTGKCLFDMAWGINVDCYCPDGLAWNATSGCVKTASAQSQEQDNTLLYAGIIAFVAACLAAFAYARHRTKT